MTVLVLMYHRTPRSEVTSHYDVPLTVFRAQIERMVDAGVRFIPFRNALESRYYAKEVFVSITFDDGHETNLDAFEVLAELGVVGTALVVTDWLRQRRDEYFGMREVVAAAQLCDIGAHGATHKGLTELPPAELEAELARSKADLEDILQREITTMSAPGGRLNAAVLAAAKRKFEVIGSSVALVNAKSANPLHRVCVGLADGDRAPLRLTQAGRLYWARRAARLRAPQVAEWVLGPSIYKRLFSGIMAHQTQELRPGVGGRIEHGKH